MRAARWPKADVEYCGVVAHPSSGRYRVTNEGAHIGRPIEARSIRCVKCLHANGVWFNDWDVGVRHYGGRYAVGAGAALELAQHVAFALVPRHHQDAPLTEWKAALRAVGAQAAAPLDAESCFQTAGPQVVSRVDDAAIAPALMQGRLRFLFEQRHRM